MKINNKLINEIISASTGSGCIKIGNIGIEWGVVDVTTSSSASTTNPFSIYGGSTNITYTNRYKYTPRVFTSFSSRYSNQISTAGVSALTTATIGAYLITANSTRNVAYLVIGIIDE